MLQAVSEGRSYRRTSRDIGTKQQHRPRHRETAQAGRIDMRSRSAHHRRHDQSPMKAARREDKLPECHFDPNRNRPRKPAALITVSWFGTGSPDCRRRAERPNRKTENAIAADQHARDVQGMVPVRAGVHPRVNGTGRSTSSERAGERPSSCTRNVGSAVGMR